LLDTALDILDQYRAGADLGIKTDSDGLLLCRSPGVGATWMDAKVGDWVITPRSGRPVELNALWYNAIRIVAQLCERFGDSRHATELDSLAGRAKAAFNRRFWNESESCCYDVIDDHGPDSAIRPNQLLAISLPFPVLDADRHAAVLQRVRSDLLTPFGPRTLVSREHGYQGRYGGNVVSRDRALHQGCVHPWLLGHYITALLRVFGRSEATRTLARQLLGPSLEHLRTIGTGQIPELFDGDAPHRPGGAIAAATSVGEILRVYVEEVLDQAPRTIQSAPLKPEVNPAVTL
jgi:glycogen debranching enzyme